MPILPTSDDPDDPDSGTTGRRDVIFDDKSGYFYMVYEVSTDMVGSDFGGSHWGHMFARSRDMRSWEKVGPLIDQPQDGFENDGPNFLRIGDRIYVYMRNRSNCTSCLELVPKG